MPARGQGPDAAGGGVGPSAALGPALGRVRDRPRWRRSCLPIGLVRLRRMLRALIGRDLPAGKPGRREGEGRRCGDDVRGEVRRGEGQDPMSRDDRGRGIPAGPAVAGAGDGGGGGLAVVPAVAGLRGAAGPLAPQHEHPGVRGPGRAVAGAVPPRAVEVADAAVGLGRAIPRNSRAGGPATGARRPFRDRGGRAAAPAGLPDRRRADRGRMAGCSTAPAFTPVPGPGLRAGGLGGLHPPAARPVGADGQPGDGVGGPIGGGGGGRRIAGARRAGLDQPTASRGGPAAAGGDRRGDRAGRVRLQLLGPPAGGGRLADRGRDRPVRRRLSGDGAGPSIAASGDGCGPIADGPGPSR